MLTFRSFNNDSSKPLIQKGKVITRANNKTDTNSIKLGRLITQSKGKLLKISSVFPIDFFPDTLIIDENKINIKRGFFLKNESIHSILLENISSVTVNTGIIFASLEIVDSTNYRYPEIYTLNFLKVKDAIRARKLIQGLIESKMNNIDLSQFEPKEIERRLEILGHADKQT